ncbi:phosphonate C-P lyase system protein PhnH [Methylobacterium oryzihabitans]|uniref:Phosphonate C-P lyase system protein PhnH n=1 Tax=Methylobacterium oryzihabitans TaxID=2499852 RepID=A0A437P5E7_9HYPH|nr:phosphonate C-P lyase system protein PhnH [Methylobacterium oryzihabitans]RVU17462.1 phosphonate C-P lyase system protein PhnH [Methylobacterium oryzihabitans]
MALARGFADPVHDAQGAFRAMLDALARPGLVQALPAALAPPAPLTSELAAIALALADADAPVWLDGPLAEAPEVEEFLRFHTGARLVADPAEAAFALVADPEACPDFSAFAQGSPAYPDRSTTLVLAVRHLAAGEGLAFEGPGIRGRVRLGVAPLPAGFAARWSANHALFPRGIDLLLAAPGRVAGLPRTARLLEA